MKYEHPGFEWIAKIGGDLSEFMAPSPAQMQQISNSFARIGASSIGKAGAVGGISNELGASLTTYSKNLNNQFSKLPDQTRKALVLLGEHGWYLDPQLPITKLLALAKMLREGDTSGTDNFLIEHFTKRLAGIKISIIEDIPHRKEILEAAFNAHSRGEYVLSVPVFLAQADGVCTERVRQSLFLKIKNTPLPETEKYVNALSGEAQKAFLSPLATSLPIAYSSKQRPKGFVGLNRHEILHGESLNYGTKLNSFKAISLLVYISHFLNPGAEVDKSTDDAF